VQHSAMACTSAASYAEYDRTSRNVLYLLRSPMKFLPFSGDVCILHNPLMVREPVFIVATVTVHLDQSLCCLLDVICIGTNKNKSALNSA